MLKDPPLPTVRHEYPRPDRKLKSDKTLYVE